MSSLTFGPGWLRALSGGDTAEAQSKPAGMKRFKLAEFRYGREEMLALFVDNAKMPKELKDFGDIILQETPSEPLSFIPLTEEEERCQVAGVNSAVVLRMSGRGAPPVRGRGAIRGARGRGRGEGQPGYYRSLSNEDGGYNNSREPYVRRPWAEGSRGGSSDRGGGRGDPSLGRGGFEPRGRIPSDRAGSTEREPWRPGQEEDDGGGWRISGQRSWRKGSADASRNWRSDQSKEESGDPAIARRSWNRANSEKEEGGNYWRHASTSSNSGLPEWCDDDDDQDVGTFDSSGQFKSLRDQKDTGQNHGKVAEAKDSRFSRQESDPPVFESATDKGSEDWDAAEETVKNEDGKTSRSSEMNDESKSNVSRDWDSGPPRGLTKEPDRESSKEPSRMSPREAGQGPNNGSDQREKSLRGDTASKTSPLPAAEDSKSAPISVSELEKQLLSGNDSGKKSVNTVNSNNIDDLTIDDVKSVAHDMRKILAESHMARTVPQGNDDEEADLNMDHIKSLIDKLDDENDDPFDTVQVTSPMQEVPNRNIDDPSIVFAKKAEPGVLIKGMQDWIYRDPQGEIQGPFSCEEMLQWFKAGYFTMGLLVRRVCDEIFLPLGDLIKLWNRVPFLPGPEPPSVTSQVYAAQLARRQQQEQFLLAQQQRKMQQQQQNQQQHQQMQQQKQQQQQHELRLLQQMQEQQQMKDMQPRPHNLNVGQEVSIWGDSPAPSPNLASTPWSPSTSQSEPNAWNHSKSPIANLEELRKLEIDKERAEKSSVIEPKKSSSEDVKRLADEDEPAKGKPDEVEKGPSDEDKGGLSPSEEELELADDDDSQSKEQNNKKNKGKKKKGANEKKKEEREKQQRREEEDRKALAALEKAQQEKMAIQKRKEEEERQKQILMQQQQLKQQQQQQILQQQQQQQQLKHQQMIMQQQAMMQQEQRRLNANEGPSWNVPTSSNAPSLAEIQRMEEERQMIIREKLKQIQAHEQQIQQQQRAASGWAEKGGKPVASLRQIQEEEARQMLARQRNQVQHQQQQPKGGHGVVSSSVWNSKNVQSQQNYGGYDAQGSASFWDDVMNLAPSLEASSQYQRSNSKSRVVSDSGFPSLNSGAKQTKKSKDEELVHRLFQQANPCDEFIQWVNKNMPGIAKFVDVPTFVGFLQDIDSTYEVHEYIRSYFGENQDAQNFAREFLEWRKRNGRQPTPQYSPVSSSGISIMSQNNIMSQNSDQAGLDGDDPTGRKKKQKKRMQKVNPSLLGFSCDADPGMVNRGAIQSAMDAWNSK